MKIATIIGARPQIIKAAAISRAISNNFQDKITEVIIHTGQHYDNNMSNIFFEELGIPLPAVNLNIGSGKHGKQTAQMIEKLEGIFLQEKPDVVVVYGDTNSTLAAAIAATKIHIPIAHIEAGLRSFNKKMPEEINRIMCDHASTLMFSPTKTGFQNLINEGFNAKSFPPFNVDRPGIFHCGDVMYDNSLYFSKLSEKNSTLVDDLGLKKGKFILATVHRNDNTDNPNKLTSIFKSFIELSKNKNEVIVLPLHPRTTKILKKSLPEDIYKSVLDNSNVKIIDPVPFLDMIALEMHCKMVITDSGGVQKEAFFFEKPCIILRPETEWIELVKHGSAIIAGADMIKILEAYEHFISANDWNFPKLFGNGKSAEFICEEIIKNFV